LRSHAERNVSLQVNRREVNNVLAWRVAEMRASIEVSQLYERLARSGTTDRSDLIFNLAEDGNSLVPGSPWLNLGYWEKASTFNEAGTELAMLLAKTAELHRDLSILDVGCGLGVQDKLWASEFDPGIILALDNAPALIAKARATQCDDRVTYEVASATMISFRAEFDRVVALESAMHFSTRAQFFRGAFQALKPGGILSITDMIAGSVPRATTGTSQLLPVCVASQIPPANLVTAEEVRDDLESIGFQQVVVKSIRDLVVPPFLAFARRQVDDPAVSAQIHPSARSHWLASVDPWRDLDYIIAKARKPNS
jgi:erythromycin 3''-O-methyltransferase